MDWYIKVLRENYSNFKGRARREEYWMFTLVHIGVYLLLYLPVILGILFQSTTVYYTFIGTFFVYSLVTTIPNIAVTVRRLHDTNHSGWMYLIAFIPIIGTIWLIILVVKEGDSGTNDYGPNPKVLAPFSPKIQ